MSATSNGNKCPFDGCTKSYVGYDKLQRHHFAKHGFHLPGKLQLRKDTTHPAPPLAHYPGLRPLTVRCAARARMAMHGVLTL